MAKAQSFIPTNFFFINGSSHSVNHFEGGNTSAEIVKGNAGAGMPAKKHVTSIRYEDIILETALSNDIKELIKNAWSRKPLQLAGSLVTTDRNFKAVYEDVYPNLTLVEITIPNCDASSKDVALFRLRMKPALIQNKKGDGRVIQSPVKPQQKAIMKSNFRLELGRLPTTRVTAVNSFSVSLNNSGNAGAGPIDFPDLFVDISLSDLEPWLEWHRKFIVEGKNSDSDELNGKLIFLAPDLREELLVIGLHNVGIFTLRRNFNGTDPVARFRVGLYCEQMTIE